MGHVRQAASPIFTGITTCGIENYTHKSPLHGYYALPLYEKTNRSLPFELDLLGSHRKTIGIIEKSRNFPLTNTKNVRYLDYRRFISL